MNCDTTLYEFVARRCRDAPDFASLSSSCHGAWPALVAKILRDLGDADCRRLLADAGGPTAKVVSDPRLPLAHPLDADWRFTRRSAESVLDHALDAIPTDGILLLVAMPTVALAACDRGLGHRIAVAARQDDPTDAALRAAMPGVLFQDLAHPRMRPFDAVAIDPPWYDAIALSLMAAASRAAKPGGSMFVCVPDRFTSPSAAPTLDAFAKGADTIRSYDRVVVGLVRYATPFFELRCLATHGIANVGGAWRTGILVRCPGEGNGRLASGVAMREQVSDGDCWHETNLDTIRIWTRSNPGAARAGPVGVAGSISAADPTRSTAWLWTSGNLVATGPAPANLADGAREPRLDRIADDGLRRSLRAALDAEATAVAECVEFSTA